MTRMKVTIVGYFDADPQHYDGETDPTKMAAIDEANIQADPVGAITMCDEDLPLSINVRPES